MPCSVIVLPFTCCCAHLCLCSPSFILHFPLTDTLHCSKYARELRALFLHNITPPTTSGASVFFEKPYLKVKPNLSKVIFRKCSSCALGDGYFVPSQRPPRKSRDTDSDSISLFPSLVVWKDFSCKREPKTNRVDGV